MIWAITAFGAAFNFASAAAFEQHRTQIESYAADSIYSSFAGIAASDIEYSLKLPPADALNKECPSALSFEWRSQPEAGNNTLLAECTATGWKAYIPAQIEIYRMVVVAAAPLSRNQPIHSSDLSLSRLPTSRLRSGYFSKAEDVDGFEVQRTVKIGQVITPYIAKAPASVKRGDWVTIVSGSGGLRVTSTGEALKDGSIGDQIPVKNVKTNARIKAWVIDKGMVSTQKGRD
ncbi:flagellar basal body P-ring formation chaperone FlgA [Reinekea marinisedimentorum]|uniref:flagellar basal body P-ring formation chaperone FlgA n=1 Tax=Reinekea marinisedimentorum TaxID=230495 RepID=UPI0014055B62|nr:flagellar basal body P-ring formation chaperone FlgA [Reinekea marinisedimentorum]